MYDEETKTAGDKGDKAVVKRLHKMLDRCKAADHRWRKRAKESVEFYFGKQWKSADERKLEARGQAAVVINRVKPTTKMVHGLMLSQPTDWLAKPVGKNDDNAAEIGTASLKYVANVNNTESIKSQAYFHALTYGAGYVLAGFFIRNPDPRSEPVQHFCPDSKEIRIDPKSKEPDASDARYYIWSRKFDLEDAQRDHPEFAKQLAGLVNLKDPNLGGEEAESYEGYHEFTPPHSAWEDVDYNQALKDDVDPNNKQVVLHELWERYQTKADLVEYTDGQRVEVDLDSPEAVELLMDPAVKQVLRDQSIYKVRYYIFCGPLLLHEADSPYKHDELPIVRVPYELDDNGDPVSFIEAIKDPQREINHRRSKMLWELGAQSVRISQGALTRMGITLDEAAERIAQGNTLWLGEAGDIEHLSRGEMASQQFMLMQDSKAEIQATSGANDDLMGYDSSSRSGKAKEVTAEQGQIIQRPGEMHLRNAWKRLGYLTMMLIQQAHTDEWTIRITDDLGKDRFITLNQREIDPQTGQARVLNSLNDIRFEIEIDLMPWTPTLRQRAADMLASMAAQEPDPMMRQAMMRAAIEASDIPDKAKILDILGEAQAQQQMMAQQQAMAQALPPDPMALPPEEIPPEAMPQI